jgi:hypothetical protein
MTTNNTTQFSKLLSRSDTLRAARLQALWEMTVEQRVAAMRAGELNMEQCCAWAARHPEQVPLLNGEFEFIAAYRPDVCE